MLVEGESHVDDSLEGVHSFMKPSWNFWFIERLQAHRTRQLNQSTTTAPQIQSSFINQIECNSNENQMNFKKRLSSAITHIFPAAL
jgi:hypothetical protein